MYIKQAVRHSDVKYSQKSFFVLFLNIVKQQLRKRMRATRKGKESIKNVFFVQFENKVEISRTKLKFREQSQNFEIKVKIL